MIIYHGRAGETEMLWPPLTLIGRGVRACDRALTALGVGNAFRVRTLVGFRDLRGRKP
jgi:hypothetical protein